MDTKGVDPYNAGYDQPHDYNRPISPTHVQTSVVVQPQHGPPPAYPGSAPNTTVVMMQQAPSDRISVTGHIIFACFVFWCCGWLLGLIAFILAMIAQDRSNAGEVAEARSLARASLGVSAAGVVVGIVAGIIIVVYVVRASQEIVNQVENDNSFQNNLDNLNDWSGNN